VVIMYIFSKCVHRYELSETIMNDKRYV